MIQISIAEAHESVGILEIDKEVFRNDSRRKYLEQAIGEKKCLVAKRDTSITGFLIYHTDFFDFSFISLVMVHPLERGKGYAKSMMTYFEKISPTKKIFSSTNESNGKMQKLFSSIGYIRSGYIENLDEGDPEIIYFKKLNDNFLFNPRQEC
ncbi:GNAT family N-acetyltransferase [Bacillus sp. CECT 9360]|uniref:GNAT family N-acetyltransferase n=1 Tax=Bacillus sp. CECT 9360 TaxID=2845821 RepID=UPI001E5BA0E7|nr:GNAT family N-acetyltransferase [Bacillus sp. CECT 9360]CAH0347068.1 hypothetical protein BCI9360_03441 [Bacillus sp. CECT 9360]